MNDNQETYIHIFFAVFEASRQGNRYLKNIVMTAAATIASRRIDDNALTKLWRAGIAAGVPGDRMKRNMARKVAVLV